MLKRNYDNAQSKRTELQFVKCKKTTSLVYQVSNHDLVCRRVLHEDGRASMNRQ
jgi:hypothetical protein